MFTIKATGDFKKSRTFLERLTRQDYYSTLDKYGQMGVEALAAATPIRTGRTASSWQYEIERTKSGATIIWSNSNVNEGVNIALILQYGHGTGTGAYVQGIDYINPAMAPIFNEIADNVWKEVNKD